MNYYECKFARENKPDPNQWAIRIVRATVYELVYIGLPAAQPKDNSWQYKWEQGL